MRRGIGRLCRQLLTAEAVIGALEDAEDYQAFEAAITVDYDVQSAVERELVLRLASLLWRLGAPRQWKPVCSKYKPTNCVRSSPPPIDQIGFVSQTR